MGMMIYWSVLVWMYGETTQQTITNPHHHHRFPYSTATVTPLFVPKLLWRSDRFPCHVVPKFENWIIPVYSHLILTKHTPPAMVPDSRQQALHDQFPSWFIISMKNNNNNNNNNYSHTPDQEYGENESSSQFSSSFILILILIVIWYDMIPPRQLVDTISWSVSPGTNWNQKWKKNWSSLKRRRRRRNQ